MAKLLIKDLWKEKWEWDVNLSRGGSRGVHREQVHPLSKKCAERLRYSNRAVTLIKQSHDHEAVHNRLMLCGSIALCYVEEQLTIDVIITVNS